MNKVLGKQTMLELYGCKTAYLNDVEYIEKIMLEAAQKAKATIIQQFFHQFSPHGISGTVVIAESHINIHTWPEYNFAAIDIFTCSEDMDALKACAYLKLALEAKDELISSHERGNLARIMSNE